MGLYIVRRLLALPLVWVGVTMLAFGIGSLAPGDPATAFLERRSGGQAIQAEDLERVRQSMHLDEPLPIRYAYWAAAAAQGDFGVSFATGQPVFKSLTDRFPLTLLLALSGTLLAIVIGVPLGIAAALRRNTIVDHLARLLALLGASVPTFWLAYLLILVFAVNLHILPVSGVGEPRNLVLPTVAVSLGMLSVLTRLTRSSMLEVLGADYLRTAWAKGLIYRKVVVGHALRNALVPIVTLMALEFGNLLGGTLIIENVFAWPGIGMLVIEAIGERDYPMIQGFVLFTGTVFVLLSLIVDVAYVWLDPRIRLYGGHRS